MTRAGLALALVLAVAAPGALAQGQSPSQVVDEFHFALKKGDRRKALELLVSDVLIFEQGRLERTRTEYARRHLAEDIAFASTTQRTVSRRSAKIQGNMAWVLSVNRNRGKFNNRPVDFTTNETVILTRVAAKWRIAHIHWSFETPAAHE